MWIASNSTFTVAITETEVFIDHQAVRLKSLERDFIESVAKGEGRVRTPRMILRDLYSDRAEPELNIFTVMCCRIRQKLDSVQTGASTMLRHVWGRGFIFGPGRDPAFPAIHPSLPALVARWVPNVKENIIDALNGGAVSVDQVLGSYGDLSQEELDEWIALYARHGHSALHVTRTQNYALA